MYNFFLFFIFIILILILCINIKFKGGVVLQSNKLPYRDKCGMNIMLHAFVQEFLYPEAMYNLSKTKDSNLKKIYILLKEHRSIIEHPMKKTLSSKLLGKNVCSLFKDYSLGDDTPVFNYLKFARRVLDINDADFSETDTYIRNDLLGIYYKIGLINPILYNNQKCLIYIDEDHRQTFDEFSAYIQRIQYLCTHRDKRETNIIQPIIPMIMFIIPYHVMLWTYRRDMNTWYQYDDFDANNSGPIHVNNLTSPKFWIIKRDYANVIGLYMYKDHINYLLESNINDGQLVPMDIDSKISGHYTYNPSTKIEEPNLPKLPEKINISPYSKVGHYYDKFRGRTI